MYLKSCLHCTFMLTCGILIFFSRSYHSHANWVSCPAWNAGSATTESSAPKYNAVWFKSRRFRSNLPARNPEISSPGKNFPDCTNRSRKVQAHVIRILVVKCLQSRSCQKFPETAREPDCTNRSRKVQAHVIRIVVIKSLQSRSCQKFPETARDPGLHQPQPESGSPHDPHLGDQKSSVLQLQEISVNSTRSRLHQPQPQSGSPHDPHLGGKPSDSNTPRHLSTPRHKSSKSKPRHSSNPRHTSNSSNQRHTGKERQDTIRKRVNRSRYTVINIYSRYTIIIIYEVPTQIVTDVMNTSNKIDVNWSCFNLFFI